MRCSGLAFTKSAASPFSPSSWRVRSSTQAPRVSRRSTPARSRMTRGRPASVRMSAMRVSTIAACSAVQRPVSVARTSSPAPSIRTCGSNANVLCASATPCHPLHQARDTAPFLPNRAGSRRNLSMSRSLSVAVERFPIAGAFTIARGSKTEAVVVTAMIRDGEAAGRGECVPYARYGETVEGVAAAVEAMRPRIEAGLTREALQAAMPAGAARNALDCALWDLDAKRSGIRAHLTAGADAGVALVGQPRPGQDDAALDGLRRPVPICADESVHDRAGLDRL